MRLHTKTIRIIAIFFIINMAANIFLPTVSYALTSGPTAPEANSFEPVDTTDMVNLNTGDFTYNVPLLEVPGPAGGYPLSLSYHAGILLNQDASWVGLGWNLNPGAITRSVNGVPDDYESVIESNRVFWEGEETEVTTVGISYGIANFYTVSAGVAIGNDKYRGYGVGGYVGGGVNVPIANNAGLGINARYGVSPWGDEYMSVGLGVGVSASSKNSIGLSASAGINYHTSSGLSAGISGGIKEGYSNESLLDISISTGSSKPSLSIGGGRSFSNNKNSNRLSSVEKGFNIDIPVYYGINVNIGHSYQRYWIDEKLHLQNNGALYYPRNKLEAEVLDNTTFDSYDLFDITEEVSNEVESNNKEIQVLGGTFANYDEYFVAAQGVSGNIRPYHFQRELYRQNLKEQEEYLAKNYPFSNLYSNEVEFRFVNDFSNRMEYEPGDFSKENGLDFNFDGSIKTGENGSEGYQNNHLAGSKHIEWFTNGQILGEEEDKDPFSMGFLNTSSTGFVRKSDSQVGGFMITNESGVTYHFSLPAYSYDEYSKSENTISSQYEEGERFNELHRPERYAYTWYLTAVTGPDYVDKNENHLPDQGDYGYWVSFEYGKWTDEFMWRNPLEGTHVDVDSDFENYSFGKKELYYLDAIQTASHTALFVKKMRHDGKSVVDGHTGKIIFDVDGGEFCERQPPISSLGLEEIILLRNKDLKSVNLENLKSKGEKYDFFSHYTCTYSIHQEGKKYYSTVNHYGDNVFDVSDFESSPSIRNNSIRVIQFETDYSLCKETPNSMNNQRIYGGGSISAELDGKLTLKKLHFLGKGGSSLLPPTIFQYESNPDYGKDQYDMWGFRKTDFNTSLRGKINENLARRTSPLSALYVDAWSLSSITTPTGAEIEIEYESDEYEEVVLGSQQLFSIKNASDYGSNLIKLELWEEEYDVDINDFYSEGQQLTVDLQIAYEDFYYTCPRGNCNRPCFEYDSFQEAIESSSSDGIVFDKYEEQDIGFLIKTVSSNDSKIKIVDDDQKFIVIENTELYNLLKSEKYYKVTKISKLYQQYTGGKSYRACYNTTSGWPDYITSGICSQPFKPKKGGGIRVKSISINQESGEKSTTSYTYENGSTSYEPFVIPSPLVNPDYPVENEQQEATRLNFKKSVLKRYQNIIQTSREVPGPGVMYGKVTVEEKWIDADENENNIPYHSTYEFQQFERGMVGVFAEEVSISEEEGSDGELDYSKVMTRKLSLKDYSSRVGELKSITLYDEEDNIISRTTHNYLHDEINPSDLSDYVDDYEPLLTERFNSQGLIEETFASARIVKFEGDDRMPYGDNKGDFLRDDQYFLMGIINKKESFPNILLGQTTTNYKTGMVNTSENLAFDFYSGSPTKVLSNDSYGNYYINEMIPAYRQYSEMGSKVYSIENKNMLTQEAMSMSYKVNPEDYDEKRGLLSASVQTWSDDVDVLYEGKQPGVWRKQASYFWDGNATLNTDGTYPIDDFESSLFDFDNLSNNSKWEKSTELTLYDVFSHGLEAVDINGDYAATRMDPDQYRVIANAANSNFHEMAFSGSEFYSATVLNEGGVHIGNGIVSNARSHTGKSSLKVEPGSKGFIVNFDRSSIPSIDLDKQYKASVWVYVPGDAETNDQIDGVQLYYKINGQAHSVHPELNKNKSKSWYLLDMIVDPNNAIEIEFGCRNQTSRALYFDDFRVVPLEGSLSSYVYDPLTGELTYILDENNFYTRFEYDAMGRLVRTSREMLNYDFGNGKDSYKPDRIISETIYNYGENQSN